jgi:hypothetical protein
MITDLLASETDIEIVGCAEGAEDSLLSARAEGANMIITQAKVPAHEPSLGAIIDELPLTILAIAGSGSTSTSINFSRQTQTLHGEGAAALVDVVRKAAERT